LIKTTKQRDSTTAVQIQAHHLKKSKHIIKQIFLTAKVQTAVQKITTKMKNNKNGTQGFIKECHFGVD